ncbi:peptidase M3A and M3B thimet/oligopeptidase F [Mucilaginibacter paludis DSM 18603]|uniref:Peptidase M3A and M3B thimet/oligopeptidase F n=2 Tax=Mucilaginibacter TaxID=423349 RepID=H1Y7N7_9SPHI|nr:peptidase M3A and M3B thimet/oligopeptidase F [Mucilaginibacter paludis DSM 18603]
MRYTYITMQKIKKIVLLLCAVPCLATAQNTPAVNVLLQHSNQPIAYDQVNASLIKTALAKTIALSNSRISAITAIPPGKQTWANTMEAFDNLQYELGDLGGKIYLASATYTDDDTRNEANTAAEQLQSYTTGLFLNEPLYKAVKRFAALPAAAQLSSSQKLFLKETLIGFENNGMKLDADGRKKLKATNDKIIALGVQFDKNIAEYKDSITFDKSDLQGVPEKTVAPWALPDGKYMIRINGPNFNDILKYADKEDTRHAVYLKYMNRAYPKNIQVLDSLFYYRQQLAQQLGFKTYAEYALVDKMAGKPQKVWDFLNDLRDKLSPHVGPELAELAELKHQDHPEAQAGIQAWDIGYYRKKLFDTKYKLNTDEIKEYFEMNSTIQGMFTVYQKLFNLRIVEVKGVPLWYAKVKAYELYMDGKKMGTFYLDLYPRPNKYTHFETANISLYHKTATQEILPVGTLICNFPEGTATEPSLLNHGDVVTLFHEFGHLIHFLLCHPAIASQNSFATKGDFVEAPSQFLENFCWQYDVLKLFARNYKTGEMMPKALFDKLKQTQTVGSSMANISQVYYASLDFTYEDRYAAIKGRDINDVSKELSAMTKVPFAEGSHFICSFGHLNSYGANYYGYLWSKVFAQDIFSVFEKNGVMDTATGIRYRKDILEKGATVPEATMLRNFLGREPNSAAFLRLLGIK